MRLDLFKFRAKHTQRADNLVADDLSRIFEDISSDSPEMTCAALLESLPPI